MSTFNRIKIAYKNETKKFKKPESYDLLLQQTVKAFGQNLPKTFKFFYQDADGDIISINCQEDLEEAFESMSALKLVVEETIEGARLNMEPDYSMRSSMNMPMMSPHPNNYGMNFGGNSNINDSVFFEEVKSQTMSKQSIPINADQATDVKNLVGFANFGCSTQPLTVEKEMVARVDTREMGSQIKKEVREACCDMSVATECKASQKGMDAKEQEVHCQILRPDKEEEQIAQEGELVCFRCDGAQVNRKGMPCRRCNGTGKLNSAFYSEIIKILREEVKSYTTQTFQRLMVDYLGKKAADQASQVHGRVTCDGCSAHPIQGIRYKCSVCPNFDLCEKCEAEQSHAHPMLKIRKPDQAPAFIQVNYPYMEVNVAPQRNMSMRSSASSKKEMEKKIIYNARFVKENFGDRFKVTPKQYITKEWTFRNTGESVWPEDTLFIQTNGDNLQAVPYKLANLVQTGEEVTIAVDLVAPELPGKYCAFFRFVHGDNQRFGQKVWCDILVEVLPEEEFQPAVEEVVPELEKQESSSLLNESEQRVSSLLSEEVHNPNFEEPEVKEEEKVEENLEVQVEEPAHEEVENKEEEKEEPVESDDDRMKQMYIEELQKSNIKDLALTENLKYMMNMGYYNFMVNYNLLTRNNNDLVVAINKLCNNLVTESIFEGKN